MPRKTRKQGRPEGRPWYFNEAAARCRGKHAAESLPETEQEDFNEAAARCRGKHTRMLNAAIESVTSMRPRLDAAENAGGSPCGSCASSHFNEAAARCRGKRRGERADPRGVRALQ